MGRIQESRIAELYNKHSPLGLLICARLLLAIATATGVSACAPVERPEEAIQLEYSCDQQVKQKLTELESHIDQITTLPQIVKGLFPLDSWLWNNPAIVVNCQLEEEDIADFIAQINVFRPTRHYPQQVELEIFIVHDQFEEFSQLANDVFIKANLAHELKHARGLIDLWTEIKSRQENKGKNINDLYPIFKSESETYEYFRQFELQAEWVGNLVLLSYIQGEQNQEVRREIYQTPFYNVAQNGVDKIAMYEWLKDHNYDWQAIEFQWLVERLDFTYFQRRNQESGNLFELPQLTIHDSQLRPEFLTALQSSDIGNLTADIPFNLLEEYNPEIGQHFSIPISPTTTPSSS